MRLKNLLWLCLLAALHAPHTYAAAADAAAGPRDPHGWCRDVTRAIPRTKLETCISADLKPWAKSVTGRDIMLTELAPARGAVARVLVIGGIHGDELTSVSIVFRWIELLKKREGEAARYNWR